MLYFVPEPPPKKDQIKETLTIKAWYYGHLIHFLSIILVASESTLLKMGGSKASESTLVSSTKRFRD